MGQEVVSIALYIIISASPSLDFFSSQLFWMIGMSLDGKKKNRHAGKTQYEEGCNGQQAKSYVNSDHHWTPSQQAVVKK